METDYGTLVRRASQLRLSAVSIAEGMRSGSFRSMFRGNGIEFTGVREYLRGDDIRSIDWNVTARMGKPFVKLFEEDRELIVFLVVDRSLSMETGFGGRTRAQTAAEIAALLAFAAFHNASPVGAVLFDGDIGFSASPQSGRDALMLLLSSLDSLPEKRVAGSALGSSLQGAYQLLKNRSLVLVISDFRTTGYETPLACLASRHDVVAVRVADPSDSKIPSAGHISFADAETKAVCQLPTSSPSFQRAWKQSSLERHERWQTLCCKHGVSPLVVSTEEDAALSLTRFFSTRDARKWI